MNDVRDAIANGIANAVGWVIELVFGNLTVTLWVLLGVAVLFGGWRLSLALGPSKTCWRCGGDGAVGGLLGGKRECPACAGSGLRPRVGSGGH